MIWIIAACILSAVVYRAGGMSKEDTAKPIWIPKFIRNSWTRDWICPLIALIALWLLDGFKLSYWWAYLLFWGLSGGALSTYWDWLFKEDNFYAHGLGCGLAGIPLLWCGVPWEIIVLRSIICTIGMGVWSEFESKALREELGRGVVFIL